MKTTYFIRGVLCLLAAVLVVACGDDDGNGGSGNTVSCGDGILATTEECEGFELRGATCGGMGFSGGTISCTASCTLDTSMCSECGNDIAEDGELCDGSDLRGNSCETQLGEGAGGSLSCTADCAAIIDADCSDPVPAPILNRCDTDSECDTGLACVATDVGGYCLEACALSTECSGDEFCRVFDTGEGACAPLPSAGRRCDESIGCAGESECLSAFGAASVCGQACDPTATDCDGGLTCANIPAADFELQGSGECSQAGGSCDSVNGFECMNVGTDVAEFACARPTGICATPPTLYEYDGNGPQDEHICDLTEPTAGGRFCAAGGDAYALCYPVFGDLGSLGACVALCDDGADGQGDLDCGSGMRCALPVDQRLFHVDPSTTACDPDGVSRCPNGYDECVDFGDGFVCARASRICVSGDPVPQ